ncbi:MAG TPA: hypothetical protein VJS45_08330, partial [Acidimicrobiia bacterium]|nr:hypothetical protein [Acidimicrobiia bacterium]
VDEALAAIKSADPVGAVATLAPQVQALAGEVGDIRSALGGEEATTETTAAALTAVVVTTSTTAPSVVPTVMARLDSAEAKLADLAQSLAAEKETSQTLSTAVDGIRTDLSAVRTELAAIKTMATNAQAAADAVAARVDTVEPKLPILTTLPDASIQPGQSADSPQVTVAIPAKAKYLVVFQAAPNNTDRCQVFFAKHNGGNYASVDAAGLDAKLSVRTMELAAGSHTFSATYFAAAAGGNNAPCNVLSPFFWLQKL